MKRNISFLVLFGLCLSLACGVSAQNQTDSQGRRQGLWVKTAKNGKKISEGHFKDGYPVDTFYYYDSKGNVTIKNFFYNEGKNTRSWLLFPNGRVQAEGEYIDKKKEGQWKYYSEKGIRLVETEYKNNLKEGKEKLYDNTGKQIIEVISFASGKRNGQFYKNLFEEGYYITNYKDDVLDGEYQEFDAQKRLRFKGQYVKGLKQGEWKVYNSSGQEIQVFTYKNNELIKDLLIITVNGKKQTFEQKDIAMICPKGGSLQIYDKKAQHFTATWSNDEAMQYFNGDMFMRIDEKSEMYINVGIIEGMNTDGSLNTDVPFGFKIIPDDNGRQLIESLLRED
ncbi:MAG: hypothetical protein IJ748_05470 [Bacteroidales bacterium]|nr:hypothetical protein [Bacteroidales bacterium]